MHQYNEYMYITPVFPLKCLSLAQFYTKISTEFGKIGLIVKKKHPFYSFSQNLLSQFFKVLGQFCDIQL